MLAFNLWGCNFLGGMMSTSRTHYFQIPRFNATFQSKVSEMRLKKKEAFALDCL